MSWETGSARFERYPPPEEVGRRVARLPAAHPHSTREFLGEGHRCATSRAVQRPARGRSAARRRPQQSGTTEDIRRGERVETRLIETAFWTDPLHGSIAVVALDHPSDAGVASHVVSTAQSLTVGRYLRRPGRLPSNSRAYDRSTC